MYKEMYVSGNDLADGSFVSYLEKIGINKLRR